MKHFSKILLESVNSNTFAITNDEFETYKKIIETTKRSKAFLKLLWIISQNPELFNKEVMENFIKGKNVSKTISEQTAKDIIKLCKAIGDESRILPQMLTASQREALINKKIEVEDLMLDLESQKGRETIIKKYGALIEKLIRQYVDKCPLSKEDLRSAAMVGLINAMNTYKNPEELEKLGKTGKMNFTSYAAFCIKHQIIEDITNYGTDVKISRYYQNKLKDEGESVMREISIDNTLFNDDGDKAANLDTFFGLADDDTQIDNYEKEDIYKKLFKYIESKFSTRDCIILYKTWGVNGYKREKVKDIAKELGISSPAVVQACNRIIKFISTDKYCKNLYKDLLESLTDDYVVGKMIEVCNESKQSFIESFIFDDLYILLESVNKWNSKDKFMNTVNNATKQQCIQDAKYLFNLMSGEQLIDKKTILSNKGTVEMFLDAMFPDKSFKDAEIELLMDEMSTLKTISDNFNIKW